MTFEQTKEHFLLAYNSNAYLNMCESDDMHNAIVALEKQIPKKVVEKKFVEDVSLNYCPCCNVRFIGWGMKHCGECGQALDWSDTNDR